MRLKWRRRPFAWTTAPLVEAALRAGVPYVDVAAEIEANADMFARFAGRARASGTMVVPAMAFFGGLGDLLVTAVLGDRTAADEAHIAGSAPLAVEAVERILTGRTMATGVASAGAAFDAPDFLRALSPHLSLHLSPHPAQGAQKWP
ncbi:saccharopine dehydrogenase family protein [Spongiactinospora rosea]|uniref:hypothetical protein n=1 Tax=Spongiactinospora rosea TaxID=2248750 RepID=UPI001CED5D35|nr:hypothetical protein [Spongiactinospora rosea]